MLSLHIFNFVRAVPFKMVAQRRQVSLIKREDKKSRKYEGRYKHIETNINDWGIVKTKLYAQSRNTARCSESYCQLPTAPDLRSTFRRSVQHSVRPFATASRAIESSDIRFRARCSVFPGESNSATHQHLQYMPILNLGQLHCGHRINVCLFSSRNQCL